MKSMTGFGRAEVPAKGWRYSVELSSVNRKQSDITVALPRDLAEKEAAIRQAVAERVSRGRVNVSIKIESAASSGTTVQVNLPLAAQYAAALRELATIVDNPGPISAADLLRIPGVLETSEQPTSVDDIWPFIEKALHKALDALDKSRETEGAALRRELASRLESLRSLSQNIADRSPAVTDHHRRQLTKRLAEAGVPLPLDDERLLKEIAIFADRCDITEELARFRSHTDQFAKALRSREPAGRAMDFLCQELHRELNTIGSKANDAEISHLIVAGKTEVEKMREQVQNVE